MLSLSFPSIILLTYYLREAFHLLVFRQTNEDVLFFLLDNNHFMFGCNRICL